MNASLGPALSITQNLLAARRAGGEAITAATIEAAVKQVLHLMPTLANDSVMVELQAELESRFSVWVGRAQVLADDRDHIAWLPAKQSKTKWRHWDRYLAYLDQQIAFDARNRLDDTTTDILGRCEDPERPGRWSRRGLVVGHVQSGKTANYIGLICKAADAGYKVIVVLTGMHKNLRTQSQIRLDEGFLGYDSRPTAGKGALRPVGAGVLDPSVRANTITTREDDGDFKTALANNFNIAPGGVPLLFVVKKNATVLKNLVNWVERFATPASEQDGTPSVRDVPLLVIDDEADQSSVDTGAIPRLEDGSFDPDYDPKPINARTRRLLHLFDKNAYVGYTATPFANIFIHEQATTKDEGEDLFPRSFIINLPAPSNYTGPSRLFPSSLNIPGATGDDEESEAAVSNFLRIVTDHLPESASPDDKGWMPPHKKSHVPRYRGERTLPPSLKRAICSFVLASAARVARGQGSQHKSMLIHVTRFTDVQKEIVQQVIIYRDDLKSMWRNGDANLRESFVRLWADDFEGVCSGAGMPLSWGDVEPHLWSILGNVDVKEINGTSADILSYEEHKEVGLSVIAVGGDKLSRGLTLEGLTTSYFLRSSRMYDTLMQMGRWFGYRPGYEDVCRLYLTRELVTWFRDIAVASEELREQFDHMVATNMYPIDYGLRVRSHPSLLVTSPVKCRSSVTIKVNFAGSIAETVSFVSGQLDDNHSALVTLLTSVGPPLPTTDQQLRFPHAVGSPHMWADVPGGTVIDFLRRYKTPESAYRANSLKLAEYVAAQLDAGRLTSWTVLLANSGRGEAFDAADLRLRITKREQQGMGNGIDYRIKRLVSPADESADLNPEEFALALADTRRIASAKKGASDPTRLPDAPSGLMIRQRRSENQGLMLIYPVTADAKRRSDDPPAYVGVALSLPGSAVKTEVTYRVNNVYRERELADTSVDA